MLRTKCIHAAREPQDGYLISIMSRHTLSDGVTPDPGIGPDSFDAWWTELAPPQRLVGDYYRRGLPWEVFATRFADYLEGRAPRRRLRDLVYIAMCGDVTLLCVEATPERCHRRLVAEAAQALQPGLALVLL